MRRLVMCLLFAVCATPALAQCPPAGQSIASLQALKTAKWQVPSDDARNALATSLLPCLADPNPLLRDEIAFEALQFWMRNYQLQPATISAIRERTVADLAAAPDPQGFRQPFAALTLAEVARIDRLKPFLTVAERDEIVQRGAAYLQNVRDYRGFDARDGWRHGVAHGADLMMQLALNPLLTRTHAQLMLAAIGAQVMPPGEQFYRYGEGERLMAPVFYLARSTWLTPADWDKWLFALVAKVPKAQPLAPPLVQTQAALAARHNLTAFLQALYVSVRESNVPKMEETLLPALKKAIKDLG
ncbi:DUF2785 domain-containing protein [Caenimonas koreensis DSM 17982]|uniref:DUF2785 domain-containing protein n=1 Tax=Caenimonas koreensis DSM 17982 TaxID=1121255 RepID=A0A844B0Q3_9BURK|nr:DUF2785 domain-containing protein [Caenimonas koreensis]MRD46872.1 DUF2785 domain-containing protein [Caenimonas koreensis DSM 17982]